MVANLLIACGAGFLVAHLVTVVMFLARLRRHPARGILGTPPVTLMRPVYGRDPFDEETLESSFLQSYPDYAIIFCLESPSDPAAPLVEALVARHPEVRARVLYGEADVTGNPKLDNLMKGWAAVTTDWVCITDSNVLLPPHYLTDVVATWREGTGLVSSPPVGERPRGFAGHLACAFLNSNQARLQFAADSLGFAYAQGKTLFWNKPMLDEAGGLAALGGWLAEDVASTKLVRGRGLRVDLTPLPFAQPVGRVSFGDVWARQLRWSRVRRDGFTLMFFGEVANGVLVPVLALIAGAWLAGWPVIVPLVVFLGVWYGAELLLGRLAGWPSGWKDILVMPVRDVLLPALWLATFASRSITWRGHVAVARRREPTGS